MAAVYRLPVEIDRLLEVMMWILLVVMGCSADPEVEAILELSGDAASGATLFASTCQTCHGENGEGGTAIAIDHPHSDAKTVKTILEGPGGMPSFRDQLSDQDIADLNEHLQTQIFR